MIGEDSWLDEVVSLVTVAPSFFPESLMYPMMHCPHRVSKSDSVKRLY